MDNVTTALTGKVNEKELFAIKLPPYFAAKAASGLVILDGLFHIVQGLGLFATVNGAEAMTVSQFHGAAQAAQAAAFNWATFGWGMLMLFIGLALWRHFKTLRVQDER